MASNCRNNSTGDRGRGNAGRPLVGAENNFTGGGTLGTVPANVAEKNPLSCNAKHQPPKRLPRTVHCRSASNFSSACGWLMRWMALKFFKASTLGKGCAPASERDVFGKPGALIEFVTLIRQTGNAHDRHSDRQPGHQHAPTPVPDRWPGPRTASVRQPGEPAR